MKHKSIKQFRFTAVLLIVALVVSSSVFGGASRQAVLAQSTKSLQSQLEDKLLQLQQDILNYRNEIQQLQGQRESLSREIDIIGIEVLKTEAQIEATDIAIEQSKDRIAVVTNRINEVQSQVDRKKNLLRQQITLIHEQDQQSLLEIILTEDSLSNFFVSLHAIDDLQAALQRDLGVIKGFKEQLDEQKEVLDEELGSQLELKNIQRLAKASLEKKIRTKEDLIEASQVRANVLAGQTTAAQSAITEIRDRIYILNGLSTSLTLEDAFRMAQRVGNKTGLRPAFLMALLKKESDWGTNVGGGYWKTDMHPRDHAAFLDITSRLGLDPDKTPVSAAPSYGWGGAMGPAQFLPQTWLAYEERIRSITGHNPPSPWDMEDAFAAAAVKLSADGAHLQTPEAEWKAAQIYFAGSRWNRPQYSFYGDSIMELASVIQAEVDRLLSE